MRGFEKQPAAEFLPDLLKLARLVTEIWCKKPTLGARPYRKAKLPGRESLKRKRDEIALNHVGCSLVSGQSSSLRVGVEARVWISQYNPCP